MLWHDGFLPKQELCRSLNPIYIPAKLHSSVLFVAINEYFISTEQKALANSLGSKDNCET